MTIIVLLIGFSLTIATAFLIALLYSMKSGQFDDTDSPAVRMLFDNPPRKPTSVSTGNTSKTRSEEPRSNGGHRGKGDESHVLN